MDRYIKIHTIKEKPKFIGNSDLVSAVQNIVVSNEIVCIYGDSGVGKTHLVDHVLHGLKRVDYSQKDEELLDRLRLSDTHIVIDDTEIEKSIIDHLKSGGRLSSGSLIIIQRSVSKIDFCNCIHFTHPTLETLVEIAREKFPLEPLDKLKRLAECANGNVRNYLYSIDFLDVKDIFRTPKDFIFDSLCVGGTENLQKHIGESIAEHGYVWDAVHENYPDVPTIDYAKISETMSQSDILDTYIYDGNWDLIPTFSLVSTIVPGIEIDHRLKREKMRPGSAWTKYGNYRMRCLKYRALVNRSRYHMDYDSLGVIRLLTQKDPDRGMAAMRAYSFEPQDIDIMNHMSLGVKLKAREIQNLKKKLVSRTDDPCTF